MAAEVNIQLPDDLMADLLSIAHDENKSLDSLAAEALRKLVEDRFWERNRREAEKRRGDMTDEQVEEYVNQVIHESRLENREL
jgi:predicted transcriptional regulator